MSISSTYGTMQAQIADDLGDRQDLLTPLSDSTLVLSPIQEAIQKAIATWEREPFYFNDLNDTNGFSTSAGQEFYGNATAPVSYGLIANVAKLDKIHVLVSNNRYTLVPRTWSYLDDISVNPSVVGQPTEYAYFAEQLRFYPIPDNAYPMTMSGTQRLSNLAGGGDFNAWTQDAYGLILASAKMYLAQHTLHDANLYAAMRVAVYGDPSDGRHRGELYMLKAETVRRTASSRVRPSHF